ncbi:MAG: sigma-54 dependent transcriptional regulator [Polaromonas sp.]
MSQLTCFVVAHQAHAALGRALCDAVVDGAADQFKVELHTSPVHDHVECDVLMPVVDSDHVSQVLVQMAAWRARNRTRVVMPITIGLSQAQLLSLLYAGALDFSTTPIDAQALLTRLQRAVGAMPPATAPALQLSPALQTPALCELVGSSPAFVKQLALLPTIAGCDAGVLILGETGTGKEVCARAIHYSSARAARPMVAVNCGAIPADLLESELFGHVRGAFTSAHAMRAGLVREAEGGTLFLDEIDSLPLPAQAKLLRFLQDMEYRAVGCDTVMKADVRVIAACNQDLTGLVERGLFRRDLFFRLHVLTVALPALRDRAEDICTLALKFMQQFAAQARRAPMGLSLHAAKRLLAHDWPGNVRELKHVIERAVLLAQGPAIQVEDLQLNAIDATQGEDESFHDAKARIVDAFERSYIERLLAAHCGNITQAAEVAQKNRRALFELIRKHGISAERFRAKDSAAN